MVTRSTHFTDELNQFSIAFQEHIDYEIIQSTNPDFNKAVVRVNIFREHRQTIQVIKKKNT